MRHGIIRHCVIELPFCGIIDKMDFEILFSLQGGENLWCIKLVDDRKEVEFRKWILRYVER